MPEKQLLENILAAQVLTLAQALKAEYAATRKNSFTSNDFIDDAVRLLQQERSNILRILRT